VTVNIARRSYRLIRLALIRTAPGGQLTLTIIRQSETLIADNRAGLN